MEKANATKDDIERAIEVKVGGVTLKIKTADIIAAFKKTAYAVRRKLRLKFINNYLKEIMETKYQYSFNLIDEMLIPIFINYMNPTENIENIVEKIVCDVKEAEENLICLIGESGSGKTQIAKFVCQKLAEEYWIVFLDGESIENSIYDTLMRSCPKLDLRADELNGWKQIEQKYIPKKKKLLIVIDRYVNEKNTETYINTEKEIRDICLCCNRIRIIITNIRVPTCTRELDCKIYSAKEIKEENRKRYLEKKEIEIGNEWEILKYPHLMYMYIESQKSISADHIRKVLSIADIYWNYNVYLSVQWDGGKYNKEKLVALWYIAPIIAEYFEKNKTDGTDKRSLKKYFQQEQQNLTVSCPVYIDEDIKYDQETDIDKYMELLVNLMILEHRDDAWSFKHEHYKNFYAALFEYNRARYCMLNNVYIEPDVTLPDPIGNFYFKLWNPEILDTIKHFGNDDQPVYTRNKYYNTLSDYYYYEEKNIDKAISSLRVSIENYDGWAVWSCGFMLKERALKNPKTRQNDCEQCYEMIQNYTRYIENTNVSEPYMAVYDLVAQFYINNWYPVSDFNLREEERIKKAEEYLKWPEKANYVYSFNKHGLLYEQKRISLKKGENTYQKAYFYYQKAAENLEPWAIARVGIYIWRLWQEIGEMHDESEALKEAKRYLSNACAKYDKYMEVLSGERLLRYKNSFMNLGWICLEEFKKNPNENNALQEAYKNFQAVYSIELQINKKPTNRTLLLLLYVQIEIQGDIRWEKIKYVTYRNWEEIIKEYQSRTENDYSKIDQKLGFDTELVIYHEICSKVGNDNV